VCERGRETERCVCEREHAQKDDDLEPSDRRCVCVCVCVCVCDIQEDGSLLVNLHGDMTHGHMCDVTCVHMCDMTRVQRVA